MRVDGVCQDDLAIIIHGFNEDLGFANRQIIEAILRLSIPILRHLGCVGRVSA